MTAYKPKELYVNENKIT